MQQNIWRFFNGFSVPMAKNFTHGRHCNIFTLKIHPPSSSSLTKIGYGQPSLENLKESNFLDPFLSKFFENTAKDTSSCRDSTMTAPIACDTCVKLPTNDYHFHPAEQYPHLPLYPWSQKLWAVNTLIATQHCQLLWNLIKHGKGDHLVVHAQRSR